MHQIRFRLRLRPRPCWGSSRRSSGPPTWIQGIILLREMGREKEKGKGEERKRGMEGREEGRGKGDIPPPWLQPKSATGCKWSQPVDPVRCRRSRTEEVPLKSLPAGREVDRRYNGTVASAAPCCSSRPTNSSSTSTNSPGIMYMDYNLLGAVLVGRPEAYILWPLECVKMCLWSFERA